MKYTKPVLIKLGTIAMIKAGGGTYRDIGSNKFGEFFGLNDSAAPLVADFLQAG